MSDNYKYVPCGTCRGAKFMMKLGGIYGECNTCEGTGEVKQKTEKSDRHLPPSKRLTNMKKDKAVK